MRSSLIQFAVVTFDAVYFKDTKFTVVLLEAYDLPIAAYITVSVTHRRHDVRSIL